MRTLAPFFVAQKGAGRLARHLATSTNSCSRRSPAGRRGGHVTTRALSSWSRRPAAVSCSRHRLSRHLSHSPLSLSASTKPKVSRAACPITMPPNALRGIALGRKSWLFVGSTRAASGQQRSIRSAWLARRRARVHRRSPGIATARSARNLTACFGNPRGDGCEGSRVASRFKSAPGQRSG
jgi:hypothetical protein